MNNNNINNNIVFQLSFANYYNLFSQLDAPLIILLHASASSASNRFMQTLWFDLIHHYNKNKALNDDGRNNAKLSDFRLGFIQCDREIALCTALGFNPNDMQTSASIRVIDNNSDKTMYFAFEWHSS